MIRPSMARIAAILCYAATARGAEHLWNHPALFTPPMLELRARCSNELAATRSQPSVALSILREEISKWEKELAERRRTGNVRGIAVASDALKVLQTLVQKLERGERAQLSEPLRHELREPFQGLMARLDRAREQDAQRMEETTLRLARSLREAAAAAGVELPDEPPALKELFLKWLTAPPPPLTVVQPTGREPAEPTERATDAASPKPVEPSSPYFASSRAGANWVPVGRWSAECRGPDVFEIKVFGPARSTSGEKMNPIVGRATQWQYTQDIAVQPGNYAWRLKRLEEAETVDVVEWPTLQNDGRLVIRTRMPKQVPAKVAFEIEYSTAQVVDLRIESDPPEARVFVNGEPYREQLREVRTPCTIHLPPGTYALRLSLEGYQDAEAKAFRLFTNTSIRVRLSPLDNAPGPEVTVDPQRSWAPTGIQVNRGDRVRLAISGQWACGKKGEMVGPEGYDPSQTQYNHYYLNPREGPKQFDGAPYGALLVRIGEGPPFALGRTRSFVADRSGPLLFDVNEVADSSWRRDNRGALRLKVFVQPGESR